MKTSPLTRIVLLVVFGFLLAFILLYFLDCKHYEQSQPKPVISLQTIDIKINENAKQIDSIRAILDTLTIRQSYRDLQNRYPGYVDSPGTKASRKDATPD